MMVFDSTETYRATLLCRQGKQQTHEFVRLTEAILWLAREMDDGEGINTFGEIYFKGNVLWRRGVRPLEFVREH